MERVYAFTDEYGSFGWKLEDENVSTHFIITAIIVEESKVDSVRSAADKIRQQYFQTGEMKSKKVGKDHARRCKILSEILKLDISIFPVVIGKHGLKTYKGLQYKKSFYKFLNDKVHFELRRAFSCLTVIADELGTNEYMESFKKYFEEHSEPMNLLGESNLMFSDSKGDVLIQLADFVSGTLAYVYDEHKKDPNAPNYLKILASKLTYVHFYPKTYDDFIHDPYGLPHDYDKSIAELCYKQAALFLNAHENNPDPEVRAQCIVLDYMLFRMVNNSFRGYIPTKELKNQLIHTGIGEMSTSTFRLKIICKLRDAKVIISSSPKGYKIPTNETELYDFINHGSQVVLPMLSRLKKCRDLIKLATNGKVDLFNHEEYKDLKDFFDLQDHPK